MDKELLEKMVAQLKSEKSKLYGEKHIVSPLMDDQVWEEKGRPYCWQHEMTVGKYVILTDSGYGKHALFENGELLGVFKDIYRSNEVMATAQPYGVYERVFTPVSSTI